MAERPQDEDRNQRQEQKRARRELDEMTVLQETSQQDLDDMVALALRVNDFMSGMMLGVGIRLIDFKIEIGRVYEGDFQRLIVADEISPDSCRLWEVETGEKLDKDVFRRDLGSLADAYTEVAKRLGVMPKNGQGSTVTKLVH